MSRLSTKICALAVLPLVACSTPEFHPRMVNTPGVRSGEELLAEGRMQFRNGNFALAVNAFRRVLRESPQSVEALNGLAASYDRLGRFDLAERYYQEALAIAPTDIRVMHNYAVSLRMQGREGDVEQLRIAAAAAVAPPLPANPILETPAASAEVPVPAAAPATTDLTASSAQPVASGVQAVATVVSSAPPAAEPARSWSVELPAADAETGAAQPAPVQLAASSAAPVAVGPTTVAGAVSVAPTPASPPARSWTIDLPAEAVATPSARERQPGSTAPAPEALRRPPPAIASSETVRVPRLERLSTGEVALITRPGEVRAGADGFHRTQPQPEPPRSVLASIAGDAARQAVSRIPARAQAVQPGQAPMRILNAVGRRGQAGRMERHLRELGWGSTTIGDARSRRAASVIIAPPAASTAAARLAAALPFRPRVINRAGAPQLLLVLGRDAVPFDRQLVGGARS